MEIRFTFQMTRTEAGSALWFCYRRCCSPLFGVAFGMLLLWFWSAPDFWSYRHGWMLPVFGLFFLVFPVARFELLKKALFRRLESGGAFNRPTECCFDDDALEIRRGGFIVRYLYPACFSYYLCSRERPLLIGPEGFRLAFRRDAFPSEESFRTALHVIREEGGANCNCSPLHCFRLLIQAVTFIFAGLMLLCPLVT